MALVSVRVDVAGRGCSKGVLSLVCSIGNGSVLGSTEGAEVLQPTLINTIITTTNFDIKT